MSGTIPNEMEQAQKISEPEQHDLDPDGDVVLVVESQNVKRFLASSKILSLASPVFSKMLSSNFREGMQMAVSYRPTIVLHDDDPFAMKTMLGIFHHKELDEKPMTAERLAVLAIHSDKYDCVKTLKPRIFMWFHSFQSPLTVEEHGFLMLAAHVFRAAEQFLEWSGKVQSKLSPSSFAKWESVEMLSFLPDGLRDDLASQMERLLFQIYWELQTVEKTLSGNKTSYMFDGDAKICINCGDVCGNSAKYCYSCRSGNLTIKCCTKDHRIAEYFAALRASRLWPSLEPFQSCSTEEIASRISLASNSVKKHNCKAGYCPLKQQLDNLVKKMNVIIGEAKGLTLYPLHPESTE